MESAIFYIIVGLCSLVAGFLIAFCIFYRKEIGDEIDTEKKLSKPKVYEISMDQLQTWIDKELNKDKPLSDQFIEWLSSTSKPNLLETANSCIEGVSDCIGNACPCSPAREDCCKDFDSGKCKVIININKLCGIEDYERNPKLLTVKEAEMLANTLANYFKEK